MTIFEVHVKCLSLILSNYYFSDILIILVHSNTEKWNIVADSYKHYLAFRCYFNHESNNGSLSAVISMGLKVQIDASIVYEATVSSKHKI